MSEGVQTWSQSFTAAESEAPPWQISSVAMTTEWSSVNGYGSINTFPAV